MVDGGAVIDLIAEPVDPDGRSPVRTPSRLEAVDGRRTAAGRTPEPCSGR